MTAARSGLRPGSRGTCKRCGGDIRKGDRIRYAGSGRTYHFKADCLTVAPVDRANSPDQRDHDWIPVTPTRGDRSRTCPICKRPDVLTYDEARRGYQCHDCTRAEEGPMPERFSSDFEAERF